MLPPLARAGGLVLFFILLGVAAIPLIRLRLPDRNDALRRLDRGSGEAHRPATSIADRMAANAHDPVAQALWQAHVERALLSARKLKAGWPSPQVSLRDPVALRALALILLVATFFAAPGERLQRIAAAFDWQGVVAPANFRIDAWVNPPVYTGRPPVMLPGLRPGEAVQAAEALSVPAGSQLVVRSTGQVNFELVRHGGVDDAPAAANAQLPAGTTEHRFVIKGDGSAGVRGVLGRDLNWNFSAIPDRAPTIEFTKDPERQARGALRLDYKVEDDYGVTGAKAIFALKDEAKNKDRHPLFKAPELALALPQLRTRAGAAQTTHDLTEHPWAGAEVTVTLVAKDEGGNEGRSEQRDVTLPQRIFVKPLARALIEQRRESGARRRRQADGAHRARRAHHRARALHAARPASISACARSISTSTMRRSDDQLRDVVARLWDMALQIEDGNVSHAEQALRQAEDALRQALERGASDEELKKLMDNLRAAMDKFLQSLAEEMRKNPQQLSRPLDRNTRMLSQRDLKSMLDRLEQMARSGNKDAARQLLEQLQSMMENLQMARPGASPQDGDDDMNAALDELGDMIRKQQQLRDKTYKQGQDQRRDRQLGRRGPNDRQMGDLKQDQQGLKDRLNKLLEQLRKRGLGNPQQGQKGNRATGPAGPTGRARPAGRQ